MITKNIKSQFNWRLFFSTRKYFCLAIGLFALSLILIVFISLPQFQTIQEKRQVISPEEETLQQLQDKIMRIQQVQAMPEFKQSEKVNQVLPSDKPLLELLNNLNQISKKTEVIVNDLSLSPGLISTQSAQIQEMESESNSLDIEIEIKGSLTNVQEFMTMLEQVSPLTTIKELELTRTSTKTNKSKQAEGQTEETEETPTEEETNLETESETGILASAKLLTSTYFYGKSVESTVDSPLPSIGAEELQVLALIEELELSDLKKQTNIVGGDLEDLFGIEIKKLYQKIQESSSPLEEIIETTESENLF